MVFVTSYYFDGDYGKIPIWTPPPEGYSGIWTNWHENGIRAFKGSYDRGMRQGSWRFWFPNGQIQLEGTYKGGLSNGKWTWWHANQGESFLGRKWLIGKKIKKELDKPEGLSHAKMV